MDEFRAPSANRGFLNERSHLTNSRFLQNLNGWAALGGASYLASDGSEQYGLANLPAGASISQPFAVEYARNYTLHIAVKGAAATIGIVDNAGNAIPNQTAAGSVGVWTETSLLIGLAPGTQYTITVINANGTAIQVDDVWLWYVPITRAGLAARVARKLSALATDANLTSTSSGTQTEGDYTDAVDAGLRAVGAVNPETDLPDVRYLDSANVDSTTDAIEREMLERLQRYYATLVDTRVDKVQENLSQIAAGLRALTSGTASGPGKVVARSLRRYTPDYEF